MTEVQASKQLPGTTRLWRYLSLDKLVDLLSTSELFFTPLATFAKTDPFEGYLPSVAFDAHASISSRYVKDLELAHQQLAEHRRNKGYPLTDAERVNTDDRLSLDPLGPVEGGNGIVEGSHVADVCPQLTIPEPLDEFTQLGAIGFDDKVDSKAARGPRLGRAGDGHQRSSARIRPTDRFAMSPPMTSKTRSTRPTSSKASLSRSTNSCAPKSRAV
jgi:hypothetical protein